MAAYSIPLGGISKLQMPCPMAGPGLKSSRMFSGVEFKNYSHMQSHMSSLVMCSMKAYNSAIRSRCSTEQQTIQNPVATKSPVTARQKENLPKLDDSGPGGGQGRGDGGGGGGGGGGGWTGGFFLWSFLMLVAFLRDQEKDKPYRHQALNRSRVNKMRQGLYG